MILVNKKMEYACLLIILKTINPSGDHLGLLCMCGLLYSEFVDIAHEFSSNNKTLYNSQDVTISLSDNMPEPESLVYILRISPNIKEIWRYGISGEIIGLFDNNDTLILDDRLLAVGEIILLNRPLNYILNSHGGLGRLKERIYIRCDIQIKDDFKSWSSTESTRLLIYN